MFNGEPTADDHGNVLYEIRKDPVVGRYMVASRDIQPGEVIFTDSPVAIGKLGQPIPLICDGEPGIDSFSQHQPYPSRDFYLLGQHKTLFHNMMGPVSASDYLHKQI